jgi:hypothetical protein
VQSDYDKNKQSLQSNSHTAVPIPDYSPLLIYIWNPANVTQFIVARVFSQGANGSYTVFHNNGMSISSVNNGKVNVNTDLGYNLSYKYIC